MKRFVIPGAAVFAVIVLSAIGAQGADAGPEVAATPTPSATQPSPSPSAAATTFTMPDLVGENLQAAQDELQALGSYFMDQQDASGDGRLQINDSNWQVCSQTPAAGEETPIVAMVILAAVKNDESCPGAVAEETTAPAETTEAAPDASMTVSQEQAVRKAEQYLDFTSFSKSGLADQLEYEGFSKSDSSFAVDQLDTDWNEQAAAKAQTYLDMMAFSRSGLIDQLVFDGFTQKQAEYGVKAVGL